MRYPIRHIYRHQDYHTPRTIDNFYPDKETPGWVWLCVGAGCALLILAAVIA